MISGNHDILPDDLPVLLGGRPVRAVPFPPFPRAFGGELDEVRAVLESEHWLDGEATRRFEEALAQYLGAAHAVAVNTGGMALQIAFRVLGIHPGDEILFPVNTCVADAFAAFNAGAVPIFADTRPDDFRLDWDSVERTIGPYTRAIVAVHLWGRPEDMDAAADTARRHGLPLIDDACAACGAEWRGVKVGTLGRVGVLSFGAQKPFQAGGGGALITDDPELARAMRVSRAWGDKTREYGLRDQDELAWNGRISDVLAAVLLAQLRGYPAHLERMETNAARLERLLDGMPGLSPLPHDDRITAQARTQFVFRADEDALGFSLDTLAAALEAEGLPSIWHAGFEPVPTLSFFAEGRWRAWAAAHPDHARLAENYARPYPGAERGFDHTGISIGRNILCGAPQDVDDAARILARIADHAPRLAEWERAGRCDAP